MNSQNFCWQDSYGRIFKTPLEIEDTHLANIIFYLKTYRPKDKEGYDLFLNEAKRRGLTDEFLAKAEMPHKSPDSDEWMMWSPKDNRPMPIPKPTIKEDK